MFYPENFNKDCCQDAFVRRDGCSTVPMSSVNAVFFHKDKDSISCYIVSSKIDDLVSVLLDTAMECFYAITGMSPRPNINAIGYYGDVHMPIAMRQASELRSCPEIYEISALSVYRGVNAALVTIQNKSVVCPLEEAETAALAFSMFRNMRE